MPSLSFFVKKYKGDLSKVHSKSCLELGNRVVEDTPVDTGRAKQSWGALAPPKLGVTYEFSSNLVYMPRLEYLGHSDQAPNGMLRINLRNWNAIVRANIKANL